jgi:acyl-CoA thioester hydrolase
MTSKIYQADIIVRHADLDELNHVNNVVYLQWVQDVAAAHWKSLASKEILTKYFWVALRHEIDYHSPAFLHDELIAKTWVVDYQGAKSTRIVQLIRKQDDWLLTETKTTWCLMSHQNRKPSRIGDEIRNVFQTN